MSRVEFETDTYSSSEEEKVSKLTKLIIKLGAKDVGQANKIMLGVAIAILIITGLIIVNNFSSNKQKSFRAEDINVEELSPEEIRLLTEAGILK